MKISANHQKEEFDTSKYIEPFLKGPPKLCCYDETTGKTIYMIVIRTETIPELCFYFSPVIYVEPVQSFPAMTKTVRQPTFRKAHELYDQYLDPYQHRVSSLRALLESPFHSQLKEKGPSFDFDYFHEF